MPTPTVTWENNELHIIDQTLLPTEYRVITLSTIQDVWDAIKQLQVRGAPAIGVCAALGIIVGINEKPPQSHTDLAETVKSASDFLATSRPTAVNLFWALDRMRACHGTLSPESSVQDAVKKLTTEALQILDDDKQICRSMGQHGASLINEGDGLLTHCNAGALATADYGTALAVMYSAHDSGRKFSVYADETRPLLQGSRLTAWELDHAGIDVTVICDSMAAQVMREGKIQKVFVGSDRIAANGDTANKIGTYGVALLAKAHNIPFYVVAPTSTIDPEIAHGDDIPIEIRDPDEIINGFGKQTVPHNIKVYNPAFDVTPNELITGIITEHGIHTAPYTQSLPIHCNSETKPT
ncbi:MAG: S-methyl-5-thioribose-1-phosphate isomerase [Candidatus Hydrogenedentota bacterium]